MIGQWNVCDHERFYIDDARYENWYTSKRIIRMLILIVVF